MNDKLTVSNTMKDVISPATTEKDYVHETFIPGFDPHGNHTKIEREEDLEINGVNLVGSSEESLSPATHISCAPRLFMVGDHMSQSNTTKGVVVEAIPDDQLPTDSEGNKADLEVALPCMRRVGMSAAFDGDTLSGEDVIVFVVTKPKQPTNHQRHGYSRRKAKRAYQSRAVHRVKLARYRRRHTGYLSLLDDNGNFVSTKNDQFAGVAKEHLSRLTMKNEFNFDNFVLTDKGKHYFDTQTAVDSFTQLTKPNPDGKSDFNGA